MTAIVVYESIYGNTRAVAEAIAEGLGDAAVRPVHDLADAALPAHDLLVVGGPTHMHGLTTALSRKQAVAAAKEEDGHAGVEPGADAEHGLRHWLKGLDGGSARAAAFDTRIDRSKALTGAASRGIAKRLRHRGYEVTGVESFFVDDAEGPLADGELERARAWGAELARQA